MLLCSKTPDSSEEDSGLRPRGISDSLDKNCGGDAKLIKQAAEHTTNALLRAAEDKRTDSDSSDLPRLLQLHELCCLVL